MRAFTVLSFLTLAGAIAFAQENTSSFSFANVINEAVQILGNLDEDLMLCKVDYYPLGRPGRAVPYQQLTNVTFTARASNDSFFTLTATSTHGFSDLESYNASEVEIKSDVVLNGTLSLDIGSAATRVKPNGTFSHASILQMDFASQNQTTSMPVWRFYIGLVTNFGQDQCTISMDESIESCVA